MWRILFGKKKTSFHQVWGTPFILTEFTWCGWTLYKQEDFLSPGVRESFYSDSVHPHHVWRDLFRKKKDFLSPGVRGSFYSGRVSTPHVWRVLFLTKKDFISPGVGKSFYSGGVPTPCVKMTLYKQEDFLHQMWRVLLFWKNSPHIWCEEISLERIELPFTKCEKIVLVWQSFHTMCGEISLERRRLFFHQVWGVLLFWQSSTTKHSNV